MSTPKPIMPPRSVAITARTKAPISDSNRSARADNAYAKAPKDETMTFISPSSVPCGATGTGTGVSLMDAAIVAALATISSRITETAAANSSLVTKPSGSWNGGAETWITSFRLTGFRGARALGGLALVTGSTLRRVTVAVEVAFEDTEF